MKFQLSFSIVLSLLSIAFYTGAQSQSNFKRTLYVVRHAEKDTGNNPPLTLKGLKRAGDLYRELKNNKIDLIFTSNYRRTVMTADSLRIYNKVDTVYYVPDVTGDKLFEKITERAGDAKNILIIGHSNTLPGIIRKAGVNNYSIKELPETEYDNLFIIKQKENEADLKQEKYGDPSMTFQPKNGSEKMLLQ